MNEPFFSVIIPAFNSAATITKSIGSIVNQPHNDVEVVVVDDGSTDETAGTVAAFGHLGIRYVRQENSGASVARNYGASLAKGAYLVFLDSDDWLSDDFFAKFREAGDKHPFQMGLGFVRYLDADGKRTKTILPSKSRDSFAYPICGAFVVSTALFRNTNGYDPRLTYSENTDLFLRMELEKLIDVRQIAIVPQAGVYIPVEDNAVRSKRYTRKRYDSMKYFMEKHRSFFDSSVRYSTLFHRVFALSAIQNNKFGEARRSIRRVIFQNPFSVKDYFRYFLLSLPPLARYYYKVQ